MVTDLVPERPLLISPTLAATIGLDEAVMLHVLSELMLQKPVTTSDGLTWIALDQQDLSRAMPFWNLADIKRIQNNLLEKGLIQVDSGGAPAGKFRLAINQARTDRASTTPYEVSNRPEPRQSQGEDRIFHGSTSGRATKIADTWWPDEELYHLCAQRNIPREFINERVRLFVMTWQERGKTQYSWHNTFFKFILKEWEESRSHQGLKELEAKMSADWQPSTEAFTILEHAGVSRSFIEDAVPEFTLYWREKGLVTSTWNTKFIAHIRRQWARYEMALEHDATPKPVPVDYQPSDDVYDVLAMANIDEDFARGLIPEFILYWQERKELSASWHTKYLQHVKYKWAHREQAGGDIIDRITDRSWAS